MQRYPFRSLTVEGALATVPNANQIVYIPAVMSPSVCGSLTDDSDENVLKQKCNTLHDTLASK